MMKLTDGSQVFHVNVPNAKKQLPIHIATQNIKNQPATIRLLYHAMPQSLEVVDDDGMTPLHYGCQRTGDVALIETILSYKKDNINRPRKDGLTALDLINNRTQTLTPGQASFPIDPTSKEKIIQCLRNNGAKSGVSIISEILPQPSPPYQDLQQQLSAETCNSPQHSSPSTSPSYSQHWSPRTPSIMSPSPLSQHEHINNSVESSPWSSRSSPPQYTDFQPNYSTQIPSPTTTPSPRLDSPVQEHSPENLSDIEEREARLIYQHFPELQNFIALLDEGQE